MCYLRVQWGSFSWANCGILDIYSAFICCYWFRITEERFNGHAYLRKCFSSLKESWHVSCERAFTRCGAFRRRPGAALWEDSIRLHSLRTWFWTAFKTVDRRWDRVSTCDSTDGPRKSDRIHFWLASRRMRNILKSISLYSEENRNNCLHRKHFNFRTINWIRFCTLD